VTDSKERPCSRWW